MRERANNLKMLEEKKVQWWKKKGKKDRLGVPGKSLLTLQHSQVYVALYKGLEGGSPEEPGSFG